MADSAFDGPAAHAPGVVANNLKISEGKI